MQKIIVPIDFSETSSAALRFATFLAEVMDLDLLAVHVFDPNFSLAQAVSTGAVRAKKEQLKGQLAAFVQQHTFPVLSTFQGNLETLPAISAEVLEGFPSKTIRQLSERMDVALIVMGGVGSGQVNNPPDIFGRVARGVALHGQCPVMLIPADYGYPTVNALALAFKDTKDIRQMRGVVGRLLKALHPKLSFLHVEDSSSPEKPLLSKDEVSKELEDNNPKLAFTYHSIPPGPVVKQLLNYVKDNEIDLLVLGGKRRSFWEELFTNSALRPLVNRCEVPLLIIPLSSRG